MLHFALQKGERTELSSRKPTDSQEKLGEKKVVSLEIIFS